MRLSLEADARTLKRLGLKNPLSTASRATFRGRRTIRLRLSKAAASRLRRAGAADLKLRAVVSDQQERVLVRTVRLRLKR
jgi:hypothetical protein